MNTSVMLRKGLLALAVVLFFGQDALKAQDATANRLIQAEKYADALTRLKGLSANDPKNEKIDYQIGKVYFLTERFGEAKVWFGKGVGHGQRYAFNHIGLGAVEVKNKSMSAAKVHLDKAVQLNESKKVPSIYLEVARAYMGYPGEDKNAMAPFLKEAELYLYKVQKLSPDNAASYVLLGELYGLQGVEELEQSMYEQAIAKDAKFLLGYFRLGQLYKKQSSYQDAADKFNKTLELNAEFAPAYREMAEMWFLAKKFDKANEMMEKYLGMMGNDLGARLRAATFKYLGEKYDEAIPEMEAVVKDTQSILLLRLIGYSYIKKDPPNAEKGLEWLDKYFQTAKPISYIASDYEMYAKGLQVKGDDSMAVLKYLEAIKMANEKDQPRNELYSTIADIYKAKKDYPNRAKYLQMYIDSDPSVYRLKDNFALGQSYYMMKDYGMADSIFGIMTEKKPELHIGWAWRAKSNAARDEESKDGLAKPYYEKVLELVGQTEETKAKYKKDYILANRYLGAYYTLVTEECPLAIPYWEAILSVSPEDEGAKNGIDYCKQ